MDEYNKTRRLINPHFTSDQSDDLLVTVFDGNQPPKTIQLNRFRKNAVTFGRSNTNDIELFSPLVSREHGRFFFRNRQWSIEDRSVFGERPSGNGLIYNNATVESKVLNDGDFIRIDDGIETISDGVLFVFTAANSASRWNTVNMRGISEITIGRAKTCDVVLSHISVSNVHARITRENGKFYLTDNGSTNGVIVNNRQISGKVQLHEKDVIVITNSKMIFTSSVMYYCTYRNGISVDTRNVVITRGKGRNKQVTGNDISLNIKPGELVAIIGGSGAGKSTILNCMCGYLPPESGEVYINGVNLYKNFDTLKKAIGYVPQSDIVYDNLTLYDMLSYTAKLRLPKDTSTHERETAIARAIDLVDLSEKSDSYIRNLSGGQKKRASIAVELLSDPNLLFLDEPASGLDPGTERSLMTSLREMADNGKTIILVTHSTLQLQMCDKIVFMGKGGNLCYFGSYEDALRFFGVSDIVDVYSLITDHAKEWKEKYNQSVKQKRVPRSSGLKTVKARTKNRFQLPILCARYIKLVVNDRQRLFLLLAQAPLLALLIALVSDGKQFDQYEMTKGLLFALSCSAFWVGMLNAIQEVCKERAILKREYMTGLSLNAYIISKIIVLGLLCLIQSVLIVTVFAFTVGMPKEGLMIHPYLEFLITTFLSALSATAMGLFVSSLFTNADRAMTVAPLLLMPQILFSGLIFKLEGPTEMVSWFAICRWSMEGYGTTANLNDLELKLQQEGVMIPHEAEAFFEFTQSHMLSTWLILFGFVIGFLVLARIVLHAISKENA